MPTTLRRSKPWATRSAECWCFPGIGSAGSRRSVNAARGFHPRIKDRLDLTLECIRRHYLGTPNPLEPVLARYAPFFSLFGSFEGCVDFFLPFDDFSRSPLPLDAQEYLDCRARSMEFVRMRNQWVGPLTVRMC